MSAAVLDRRAHPEAADETKFGHVVWHCSEEDSGPDVGETIGLGGGWVLWVGEITTQRHCEALAEADANERPSEFGRWIILYGPKPGDTRVIGKCLNEENARFLIERFSLSIIAEVNLVRARAL